MDQSVHSNFSYRHGSIEVRGEATFVNRLGAIATTSRAVHAFPQSRIPATDNLWMTIDE